MRIITGLVCVAAVIGASCAGGSSKEKPGAGAEVFAPLNASVGAGLLFTPEGQMLVARDGKIMKYNPDGSSMVFVDLEALDSGFDYFFSSPLIWDMAFTPDGHIMAAAQDRILSIAPDGSLRTLVKKHFSGFLGASGIDIDSSGNLYVTDGPRILRYNREMDPEVFIDASGYNYNSFFSLSFNPEQEALYVSDFFTKTVLRYPLKDDGSAGDPLVVVREPVADAGNFGAPLNIIFTSQGTIYVSIDGVGKLLKIDSSGQESIVDLGGAVMNHIIAIGGPGFDRESLYMTTYDGRNIYRFAVGEKGK